MNRPEYASNQLSKKLDIVEKRIIFKQFKQKLVHADIKSTIGGIVQQKLRTKPSRGQNGFGFHLQTFPWHSNTRKMQPKTWNTDKKLIPIIEATVSNKTMK